MAGFFVTAFDFVEAAELFAFEVVVWGLGEDVVLDAFLAAGFGLGAGRAAALEGVE